MNDPQSANVWRWLILGLFAIFACTIFSVAAFFIGLQVSGRELPTPEPQIVFPTDTAIPESAPEPTPTQVVEPTPTEAAPLVEPVSPELDLFVPLQTPLPPLTREAPLEEEDLALLFEVWEIIARQFDGELPAREELLYSAINGSMDILQDEFTRFIPPEAAARMRQDLQGSFEGIGAFIRMTEDGNLEIVRPMAQQPAALAGLLPGDVITGIDGEPVLGMTLDEAIARVRGPEGTTVVLTIVREGVDEPFDVSIVRQRIEIAIVESQMLEENIGYVHLTSFSANAEEHLHNALQEIMVQRPSGLIFDLRDNPGGFLDQSVAVADLFLPEGTVLRERNIRGLDEVFTSKDGDLAERVPLVVLVNAGSASASEIVAGAIQDRDRAILIGETTFGKGSVQQTHSLSDGSELRVTVARWYTPDDNTIDGIGITPDIEVLPSPIDLGGPDDTQLQRALEYLLEGQ